MEKQKIEEDLMAKGVMISYNLLSQQPTDNNTSFSGSGICFGGKWVLTHGGLFSILNITKKILKYHTHSPKFSTNKRYNDFPKLYIYSEDNSDVANFLPKLTIRTGKVIYMWKCELLSHTVDNVIKNWTFGKKSETNDNIEEKNYFPVIALIEITDSRSSNVNIKDILLSLYDMVIKRAPIRGDELQLESTPFGNEVFINSLTKGIICNSFGLENCVVMCDASSTACCEGGPAFTSNENALFGMIVNSLSWCRGEWVGLTLVVYLAPILHHHLFQNQPNSSITSYTSLKQLILTNLLSIVDSTVVRISCGTLWGSGVVLGNGYILTCSHLIKNNYSNIKIKSKNKTASANVIFKSSDNKAYDLALLYTHSKDIPLTPVKFSKIPAIKGEKVVAIGYPYFNDESIGDHKPTITRGRVTNVNPYSLQTSCCIQSGYSGGAIMRFSKGIGTELLSCEILGIIVCNTKDESKEVSFPHVNMAIPIHILEKPLQDFISKKTAIHPQFEGDTNDVIKSFWNFKYQNSHL